jgi:hypothetical protein
MKVICIRSLFAGKEGFAPGVVFVSGYLYQLEPVDKHTWFEAFVGDRWYTFDSTQAEPQGNRITIAYNRDAAYVALATQFGPLELTEMEVWVNPSSQ